MSIYMDYAATTPMNRSVLEAMRPYFFESFTTLNYREHIQEALETASKKVADAIGAEPGMIRFTFGGTHANHLALEAVAGEIIAEGRSSKNTENQRKTIVISAVEHPSVRNGAKALEERGFSVEICPVDALGKVDLKSLEALVSEDTALVSVMLYNNETGTRQPVEAIAEVTHLKGALFHIDAVQGMGAETLDVKTLGADLLSVSAHKIYGPKGCGALYNRNGWPDEMRCDAYANLTNIVGFGQAAARLHPEQRKTVESLKVLLMRGLDSLDAGIRFNGLSADSHPGILNVYFQNADSDALLIGYDMHGIAVSAGSACSSGAVGASPVLLAMGFSESEARRCLRFSMGEGLTKTDIEYVVEVTRKLVKG